MGNKYLELENGDIVNVDKEDRKEFDAEIKKWEGIFERHPEIYQGETNDLPLVPKYLLPILAEKFDFVKKYFNKGNVEIETEIKNSEISKENFLIEKGENKKTGEIEYSVDIDAVAEYLISEHYFKTWFGVKADYSFAFDGRVFNQDARGIVKVECEKLLENHCKRNVVDEIFEKIKRKTKINREEFEKTNDNFICFQNGVWDIEGKKLLPHDPKYNFQTHIPRVYDENAECPLWMKFVNETIYPEDIPVMQEWFGFILYREYFIKKGIILVGKQDTGKSVLLDTVIEFIGERNKTGLSLQKITNGSDFTKLSLRNKHLNCFDDLSSKDLNDGGAFKVATGGGYISGEEKFGEYQQFRSFAKQMFATNKIPPVRDNDDLSYFGRWIVFQFDNVPEKLDGFLRKKLWTESEMSGILNWALDGLYRILENQKFSYNKTNEETKKVMEMSGYPLVAFESEVLGWENGAIVTKEDMFKVYSAWCEKTKRPRLSKEMLGRQLGKYCHYITSQGGAKRVWKNAKIKVDFGVLDEIEENCRLNDGYDTL